uniref:DUF1640 domain-containing protein n=1 Tax=Candidatus Kentrum eta TaxID=2126337 RepID=A0A450UIA5_9GAMM|nr:MAG: hypothetical protein BECKH772A_GA0070896_100416 [Candidatus Kentron sp. H]VFJ93202.1 MAG: hypothetical protein BECKH772B_GA0070898_100406 [Candidatus Kentron sp. H]VFK00045.1 MAG: hypothetical protein BECKH772C_GA0070978_100396 [Candidatus Kentron sp. H]
MTVMVTELYQALKESGASEDSAARTAQAVVSEERFEEQRHRLATKADLKADLAELKADITRTILIAMVAMTGIFAAIVKVL